MKIENVKYKIGGKLRGFFPSLILILVFGGFSVGLYVTHSNIFFVIGGFCFTAFIFVLLFLNIFRAIFVKMLIGENSFYFQTKPSNGKSYEYAEIKKAWNTAGNGNSYNYCCFETIDGQTFRFPFVNKDYDGVDYFLTRINGEESDTDDEDEDEY